MDNSWFLHRVFAFHPVSRCFIPSLSRHRRCLSVCVCVWTALRLSYCACVTSHKRAPRRACPRSGRCSLVRLRAAVKFFTHKHTKFMCSVAGKPQPDRRILILHTLRNKSHPGYKGGSRRGDVVSRKVPQSSSKLDDSRWLRYC